MKKEIWCYMGSYFFGIWYQLVLKFLGIYDISSYRAVLIKQTACNITTTGCFTVSVKSETPLFSDIHWRTRLSFYVVNRHSGRLDFWKKNLKFYFLVRVRTRYKLSLVFRLSPVCSKFKFMLSAGIQLFGLKTTSHGKSDLKNSFLGQIYHVKWFSGQKVV